MAASVWKMMDVTRHKSLDTLRGYVRNAESFKDHAGRRSCEPLGLGYGSATRRLFR
jgi:hypothetical protein